MRTAVALSGEPVTTSPAPLLPGLAAVLSAGPGPDPGLPGIPAWPDLTGVRLYGDWHPADVRRAEHERGRLLVLGHCLAGAERVRRDFAEAMERGDLSSLSRWPGACLRLVIRPGEMLALTDIAGQFPLYYSQRDGETVVASHAGLLAERHHRSPDPITLAARLACPGVLPLWGGRSPYQDVSRAGGGEVLRVTAGGPCVRASDAPTAGRLSRREGAEALRSALTHAVELRSGSGPVTADLSGGLDSTSLAFLAARHSPSPVRTVTYHQPLAPAGDLVYALAFARLDDRIRPAVVHGDDDTLPFRALGGSVRWPFGRHPHPATDEPAPGLLAWQRSLTRLTAHAPAGVHLTGEGGDAILGAPPSYLAEPARARRLGGLLRHCGAQARLRHTSTAGLAIRAVRLAQADPARQLVRLSRRLRTPEPTQLTWPDAVSWWPFSGIAAGWLTPGVRDRLAEVAADPATHRAIRPGLGPAGTASVTELRHSAEAQRHLRELGHHVGVRVHAPFLDDAVVRAGLAVTAEQRADPHVSKPLLRSALAGLVPGPLFDRRTKGDYTAEEYRGARSAAPAIRGLLADSRLAALGVIEPAAVRATLDRFFTGAPVPLAGIGWMLATEVWLRTLDRAQPGGG
jgi:asparagine synthase (glutamine-hydrolysing)